MDDKEFRDIALLMAVLGLTVSGEFSNKIASTAIEIVDELTALRNPKPEAGILGIRKRTRRNENTN